MLPRSTPEKREEKLLKNRNCSLLILIIICYLISILLLYISIEEFYKMKTFLVRQCKVKSIDLIYQGNTYYPKWNLIIFDQNKTTNDFLIDTIGTKSDRWASIRAKQYQINETYFCYRSRNESSIIQWNWQWNKPNSLKFSLTLFVSFGLFLIASILIRFKKRYQIKLNRFLEQQQLTTTTQISSAL